MMPNHVYNTMTVSHNDPKKIAWLKRCFVKEESGENLDFNRIIPAPRNIFKGNLGEKEKAMCVKKGIPNWYDWNISHWGTKWGAYNGSIQETTKNSITFNFDTAWSPPEPIYLKLREMGFEIEGTYQDEAEDESSDI